MKKIGSTLLCLLIAFSIQAQEIDSLRIKVEKLSKEFRYNEVTELLANREDLNIHLQISLADAQYKSGQFYAALDSYQKLYALDSNLNFLLQEGKVYEKLQKDQLALEVYLRVAQKAKNNAYFWKLTAKRAERSSEFTIALSAYATAYELQANDLEIIDEFARLLMKVEQYEIADSLLLIGLDQNPSALYLKRQRLMALYKLKRNEELVNVADELFAKGDSSLLSQKLAGISNYHEKNYTKSIALLSNVVEVEKESDLLFYYLGLSYRESGEPVKAAEFLEKSIDLSISNNLPNYYTQLAVSYEEAGEIAKAIQAYKIAYKETKDKILLYHLARNYDAFYKDKKVALNYYEKYLNEKDTANEYLMNYSKYRVQELKASVHFEADSF